MTDLTKKRRTHVSSLHEAKVVPPPVVYEPIDTQIITLPQDVSSGYVTKSCDSQNSSSESVKTNPILPSAVKYNLKVANVILIESSLPSRISRPSAFNVRETIEKRHVQIQRLKKRAVRKRLRKLRRDLIAAEDDIEDFSSITSTVTSSTENSPSEFSSKLSDSSSDQYFSLKSDSVSQESFGTPNQSSIDDDSSIKSSRLVLKALHNNDIRFNPPVPKPIPRKRRLRRALCKPAPTLLTSEFVSNDFSDSYSSWKTFSDTPPSTTSDSVDLKSLDGLSANTNKFNLKNNLSYNHSQKQTFNNSDTTNKRFFSEISDASSSDFLESPIPPPRRRSKNKRRADHLTVDKENKSAWLRQAKHGRSLGGDVASEDFSDNISTYSEPQWVGKARKKLECMNVYLSSTTDAVSISSQLTEASSTWSRGGLDALEELREEVHRISEAIEEEATAKVDNELGIVGGLRALPIMDKERSPERLKVTFDRPETPEKIIPSDRERSPKNQTRFGDSPVNLSSSNILKNKRSENVFSSKNENEYGSNKRGGKKSPSPPAKRKKDLPTMRFGDTPQDIFTNRDARTGPKSSSKFESISGPDPSTMTLGELNQNVEEYDFPVANPGKPHWELLKLLEIKSQEEQNIPEIISHDTTGPKPRSILKRTSIGESGSLSNSIKESVDSKFSPVQPRSYNAGSLGKVTGTKITDILREKETYNGVDASPSISRKSKFRELNLTGDRDFSSTSSKNKIQNLQEKFSTPSRSTNILESSGYRSSSSPETGRSRVNDVLNAFNKHEPVSNTRTSYSTPKDSLGLQDWEDKARERMNIENRSSLDRKVRDVPTSIQELVKFHSGFNGRMHKNNRSDQINGIDDSKRSPYNRRRSSDIFWNKSDRPPSPDVLKSPISSPVVTKRVPTSKLFSNLRTSNYPEINTYKSPTERKSPYVEEKIEIGRNRRNRSPEYLFGSRTDEKESSHQSHLTYPMNGKRLSSKELSYLAEDRKVPSIEKKEKRPLISLKNFDHNINDRPSKYEFSGTKSYGLKSPLLGRKTNLEENPDVHDQIYDRNRSTSPLSRISPTRHRSPEPSRFNESSIIDSLKSKSTKDNKENREKSPFRRLISTRSSFGTAKKPTDSSLRTSTRNSTPNYMDKRNSDLNGRLSKSRTKSPSPLLSQPKYERSPSPFSDKLQTHRENQKFIRTSPDRDRLTSLSSIIGSSSRSPSVSTTGYAEKHTTKAKSPAKDTITHRSNRSKISPSDRRSQLRDGYKQEKEMSPRLTNGSERKKVENDKHKSYDRPKRRTPERTTTPTKRSMRDELLNKELIRKKSLKNGTSTNKTGSTSKPSSSPSNKSSLKRNNSRKNESGGESENYESVRFKPGEGWNSTSIRRKRLSSVSSDQRSLARSDSGKSKEGRRFVSEASKGLEKWAKDIKVPGKLVKKEGHKYSHSVEEEEKNGQKTSKAISRKVVRRGSRKMSKGGEILSATTKINSGHGEPGTSSRELDKNDAFLGTISKFNKKDDLSRKLKTSTDGESYVTSSLQTTAGVNRHTTEGVDKKTTKSVELIGGSGWEGKREVSGKYGEKVVVERSGGTGVRPSTVVKKLASQSKVISTKTKKKR